MHTKTHAHAWHSPHAEALIPRPRIYAQICIHIYTHTHTKCTYEHTQSTSETTALQQHQEALPFSLSASRQRAVQTTSAYLHWYWANPPSSLSTPAPSFAMAPRNEVIFLPFWRGFCSCAWFSPLLLACANHTCVCVCVCLYIRVCKCVIEEMNMNKHEQKRDDRDATCNI